MSAGVRTDIQSRAGQVADFFPGKERLAIWRQVPRDAVGDHEHSGRQIPAHQVWSYDRSEILESIVESQHDAVLRQRPVLTPGALKVIQGRDVIMLLQIIEVLQETG